MNLNYIKTVAQKKIIEIENNINFLRSTLDLYSIEQDNDIMFQIRDYEKQLMNWKKVLQCLKYSQIINQELIDFIKNELLNLGLSNVDIIKLLEYITIHNETRTKENRDVISGRELTYIINLLNQEFKELPPVNNSNAENLDSIVAYTISLLDNNELSIVQDAMNLDNIYNDEDLLYIYTKVLQHYQDDLTEFTDMLNNEDFAFSIQILNALRNDYELVYQRYLFIYQKYNQVLIRSNQEEEILSTEENSDQRFLYYSSNSNVPEKCYFIKDLMELRSESYQSILTMIEKFKKGEMVKIKRLNYPRDFIELKDDQIRIILTSLGNNFYSVMGVFIKKSDNPMDLYSRITKRPIADINNEYSEEVENFYKNYIAENARKGSR